MCVQIHVLFSVKRHKKTKNIQIYHKHIINFHINYGRYTLWVKGVEKSYTAVVSLVAFR